MGKSRALRLAIQNDDKEALSAFGKAGAMRSNKVKSDKAAEKNYFQEKRDAQDHQMRVDANEHIVPIDSEKNEEAA